jgi:type I restriction enzyme S subunit
MSDNKLPEGWVEVRLGDVCEVGDGNHASKYPKNNEMVDSGVPFIRSVNIINGKISDQNMKYITFEKHNELIKGHLKENDILITNRGEIGKIAYVSKYFEGSNLNSQIAWIRINSIMILPRYLFFILNTTFIQNNISSEGGVLQQLTIKNIKLINIPLPPIQEQEKIANILSSIDEKINLLDNRLIRLKDMKKSIMSKLLTKEIRFPGFDEEWVEVRLGDVFEERKEKRKKRDIPVISLGKLGFNIKEIDKNKKEATYMNYNVTYYNDICYSPRDLPTGCPIYKNIYEIGAISSAYVVLKFKNSNNYDSKFLEYYLTNNQAFTNELLKRAEGTRMPEVKLNVFLNTKIPLPPLQEQEKISSYLSSIDKKIDLVSRQIELTKDLRKGLMQQLLTGQVRV